jgi:hypothetical protein
MILVIEGPDNGGKSTLARHISEQLGWPIQPSEGPDKYPGEINERIRRYQSLERVIFDRHPCVSQPIYSKFRGNTPVDQSLLDQFYASKPLLVYCQLPRGRTLNGHVVKPHDSKEHLETVSANFDRIAAFYDAWAIEHATIIRRWSDPHDRILSMIWGALNWSSI